MAAIAETSLIKFGREYLLDALSRCDDAMLDFRLDAPGGFPMFSLREHFLHIADVGELLVHEFILGEEKPEESWRLRIDAIGKYSVRGDWPTVADVRSELEKSLAFQDEHVFSRDVSELASPVGPRGRLLAEEVLLMVFHESQHRG